VSSGGGHGASDYDRGFTEALHLLGDLVAWNVVGIGANQGGGWFYEDRGIGTAPLTPEKARELHAEWTEAIFGAE
jgi:hypothetical protein